MNGDSQRAGDEVAWSGEQNGSSRGRQVWADWSQQGHDYEPQRERRECKSHTDNQQTHTPAVAEDDGKQVIDQVEPVRFKRGLAATSTRPDTESDMREEGRGSTQRHKECFETEFVTVLVRGVLLETDWK